MTSIRSIITISILSLLIACTPKVANEVAEPEEELAEVPASAVDESLSPCKKWVNSPRKDEAMNAHVIYRDFLRSGEMDKAFPYWQTAYEIAPAADGKRKTHYEDGIKFYHNFFQKAEDPDAKAEALEKVLKLYNELERCYESAGYVAGRKAFDYFYKYRDYATDKEIFDLFAQSVDEFGEETPVFVMNPFTSILVDMVITEDIPMERGQKYVGLMRASLENGLDSCDGKECEAWKVVESYAPARWEELEGVEDFYPCDYYMDKYYPEYEASREDCDVVRTVYSRLKWGKCPEDDPKMQEIDSVFNENCRQDLAGPSVVRKAYTALQEGKFRESIDHFEEAVAETDDVEKKAKYSLLIAKIYYAHLKRFSSARKYALDAASYRPNWGEPYLLIGKLYASSGPLCGPGRGWDSQIVTWPAIDMFEKARRLDNDVATEATRLIENYKQYMPSIEDIFQRGLEEGDSFRVGCWIQETTTIRAAKY